MALTNVIGSSYPFVTSDYSNNSVTYAKIQQASTLTLLGNSTASTGNIEEITLGSGLSFVGSTLTATGSGVFDYGLSYIMARGIF